MTFMASRADRKMFSSARGRWEPGQKAPGECRSALAQATMAAGMPKSSGPSRFRSRGCSKGDTAPGVDGVEDGGNFQSWPRAWPAMMREGLYDEPA
jgi:hypothetical protein